MKRAVCLPYSKRPYDDWSECTRTRIRYPNSEGKKNEKLLFQGNPQREIERQRTEVGERNTQVSEEKECTHMCIYTCVHTYREREREGKTHICVYIYILRETEREQKTTHTFSLGVSNSTQTD